MPTDAVRPRTALVAVTGLMPTLAAVGSTAELAVTDRMAELAAVSCIPIVAVRVWSVMAGTEGQWSIIHTHWSYIKGERM